ncbi:MAG: recombinase family protein, partial [Edaphobacter sp.]
IRDKIAASKKKGMWMGGTVPLGYTAQDRKLVINKLEAATVRIIFNEFLRVGSVHGLQVWLRESNIRSRRDHHFFRGPLYTILRNSHYLGLIKHKKEAYPGEHPAIIDRDTWDKVQTLLDDNIQGKRRKARVTKESLFTSTVFDEEGTLYTPTHANKNGRRYRYYTSQAAIKRTERSDAPARIPAPDLEKVVIDRLLEWLQTPEQLLVALHDETTAVPPKGFFSRIIAQAAATAQSGRERIAEDRTQFLKNVIERLIIHPGHVEIRLRVPALVYEMRGGGTSTFGLLPIASIECPSATSGKAKRYALLSGTQISLPMPAARPF